MDGEKQSNRSHRAPKSGNKADKKGTSKKLPDRGQNPKVSLTYAWEHPGRLRRAA
jgi:hypothetical protein